MFSYTGQDAKNCVVTKTFGDYATKEITAEYNLPDYLPDINRILRSDAKIIRAGKYTSGGMLEYDGTLCCTVVYSTSDGALKNAVFDTDYSGGIALGDIPGSCEVSADTSVESVNCRLQNPRKLTARIRIKVCADVCCAECTVPSVSGKLSPEEENGLQSKKEEIDFCFSVPCTNADASIENDMPVPSGMPDIEELVSVSHEPYISEIMAYDGSVSYKGYINVNVIYKAESAEGSLPVYRSFSYKIPFSGDASAEGISDGCVCTGACALTKCDVKAGLDSSGSKRSIETDIVYSAFIDAYKNIRGELPSDMYSTDYECMTDLKTIPYRTAVGERSFNFTESGCGELPDEEFTNVVSVTASSAVTGVEKTDGKLTYSGYADVCAVLSNGNGVYTGKCFRLPFTADADGAGIPDDFDTVTRTTVTDVRARAENGKLCADMEIYINGVILAKKSTTAVKACNVMKDKPRPANNGAKITLYYPSQTDTMWDIAKKYGTTKAELAAVNGISGDIPGTGVITIPKRKSKKPSYTKII